MGNTIFHCLNCVAHRKTEDVGATENKVSIGYFNVKARKTTKHILPKTWHATQFLQNFSKTNTAPDTFILHPDSSNIKRKYT